MPHPVAFKVPHLLLDLGQVTHFQIEDGALPVGPLRSVEDIERLCLRLGGLFYCINLCGHEVTALLVAPQGAAPPASCFRMDPGELTAERMDGWPGLGAWVTGADVVALRIEPRPLMSTRGAGQANVAAVALTPTGLPARCLFFMDPAVDGVVGNPGGWLIVAIDDVTLQRAWLWFLGRLEVAVAGALVQLKATAPGLTRAWLAFLNGGGTPLPIGLLWALDPDLVPSLPAACRPSAKLIHARLFVDGAGLATRLFLLLAPTSVLVLPEYAAVKQAEGLPAEQAAHLAMGLATHAETVWQGTAFTTGPGTGRRDRGHLHSLFALHQREVADLFASVELASKFYSSWMGIFWKSFPGGTELEIAGTINTAIDAMAEGAEVLKAAGYRNASRATVAAIIGCESEWDPQARNLDNCKTCRLLAADDSVAGRLAMRAHWDANHTDRAGGMTQFLGSTWTDLNDNEPRCSLAKYTKSRGITAKADVLALRFDVRLSILMGVELALYRSMSNTTYAAAVKRYFSVINLGDLSSQDLVHAVYYAHHDGPKDAAKVLGLLRDGLASSERYGNNFKANWNNNIPKGGKKSPTWTARLLAVGLKPEHFGPTDQKAYAVLGAEIAAGTKEPGKQDEFFSNPERTQTEGADAAKLRFNYAYALWLESYVVANGEPWLGRAEQFNPIPAKGP